MLIQNQQIKIFFGSKPHSVIADNAQRQAWANYNNILDCNQFAHLRALLGITHLIFDHQTHSTSGRVISSKQNQHMYSWNCEGDYLITNEPHIGIGILTADCQPIIIHDPINNALAVIHAGWRGTVNCIAIRALEAMHDSFKTSPDSVNIYFGPSIGPCCYHVGCEVIKAAQEGAQKSLETRNNLTYFDLTAYNKSLLIACGVRADACNIQCTDCTMCNQSYNSYRRNATQQRQPTVACLL